jgi:hypothetical protein
MSWLEASFSNEAENLRKTIDICRTDQAVREHIHKPLNWHDFDHLLTAHIRAQLGIADPEKQRSMIMHAQLAIEQVAFNHLVGRRRVLESILAVL